MSWKHKKVCGMERMLTDFEYERSRLQGNWSLAPTWQGRLPDYMAVCFYLGNVMTTWKGMVLCGGKIQIYNL